MTRRLENEDEDKFWEAWVKDDLIFCYRYGKLGSPGHLKLKKFKTRAEADAELEEKLAEKLDEGFVEIGAEAPAPKAAEEDDDEDDSEDEDSDDDDDASEEDEEDDEDDAPKKRKPAAKAAKPARAPAPEPAPVQAGPKVSPRVPARTPTPERIERATKALVALKAAVGGRSWKVGRAARHARFALESIGGVDLSKHAALSSALDDVMALAIAPKKRLPLEDALIVLWAVDAKTFARIVGHWRAKMLDSDASASIGVLAATIAGVPDPELAAHLGTALVNRRLPAAAFQRWFGRLRPFLEAELPKGKGLDAFLATLKPGNDAVLAARLEQVRA